MPYVTDESLARLISAIPDPHNRELARTFAEKKLTNGRKLSTLVGQLGHIRHWLLFLGPKPAEEATEADVRAFLLERTVARTWRPGGDKIVQGTATLSDSTLELRKIILRGFQAHVHGCGRRDPLPPEVAWLEQRPRSSDEDLSVTAEELITRDEVLRMIEARNHPQDKAILATLYDSAMRASEFCSLKIRNVRIDDKNGAILALDKGAKNLKTGARQVPVMNATPYLVTWLNNHPEKDDPNASLWLTIATNGRGDPLRPVALARFVKRAGREAGIKVGRHPKPLWPHLFRHSRLTELAREGAPEMEMRIFAGWSRRSDMPAVYIHMTGKDVLDGMLRRAGKSTQERQHEPALKPRRCGVCGHENAATADYCEARACGRPLTVTAAMKRQENDEKRMEKMLRDLAKPLLKQLLAKERRALS
ncbi:MAG: tyrosine-type recombinase/integrase [Thermoplasmatota archaeon]